MRSACHQNRPIRAGRASCWARLGVTAALALLATAAPAAGDVGATIINRCTHGQSLSGFSQQAYKRALQELPADVEEYSDCASMIRRAQLAAAGSGPSRGGPAGAGAPVAATPLTPSERGAISRLPHTGAAPLRVGNDVVHPGVVHANISSALSSLPDPLLAILALILACALAFGGRSLRDRVRARRPS
jgi:hypothetical protein